jgi:hypothetical protein
MADAQVTEARRLIDGLRRKPRTHLYHGRREYSDRAREVAVVLAGMIEAGRAADVVPLARRAVERVTDGMLHIDDSSGTIGHDLRALTGLYARAARSRHRTRRSSRRGWSLRGATARDGRISMSQTSLRRSVEPGWPNSRGS